MAGARNTVGRERVLTECTDWWGRREGGNQYLQNCLLEFGEAHGTDQESVNGV